MKLFIASDIHGSAYWCERMLSAFEREQADKLLLLGDLLYHGPRNPLPEGHDPKTVAGMLNRYKSRIICVRGNCDCEVDQMMLDFPVLADYAWVYADDCELFASHGHHYNKQTPPPLAEGSYLLNGHFHIPEITECEGFTYVNCGSAALPKNGTAHSYVIFEDGKPCLKEL
ncbi:MAG: phosphodiesterase [Ruminococcus sp.]|nr:phosphodiesterase [Ruminococcus sp.]